MSGGAGGKQLDAGDFPRVTAGEDVGVQTFKVGMQVLGIGP